MTCMTFSDVSVGHIRNVWKTNNKRLIGFLDPGIGTRGVTIRSQDSPRNGRRKAAYQTTGLCGQLPYKFTPSFTISVVNKLGVLIYDNRRERKDATVTADDSPIVT
ncbi:hypothetical protein [Absidia glauca]|uniref:Uncharacterized protein n=1 Tax=Absidia glauca TaxID=4829 RepID=A0A163JGI0_ABSGL|nr:hypothetical protein [Absidia glauca]